MPRLRRLLVVAIGMFLEVLLTLNVRMFDGQAPNVEVVANRDNHSMLFNNVSDSLSFAHVIQKL